MVRFKADAQHFSKSMHFMNELRQSETFCDISLLVGSQVLKAHRCVLAAGSSYFNVLFLGQFAESSMNEINLSEVTKDMSALEMIVNFLYTGEIVINMDNIGIVVKLSSYFLIETLIKYCSVFINNTLSLDTCLIFHQCAVDHGLMDIEARTTPMVKTRFHDFMIFEEETLNVPPKQLMHFHQTAVFQYCLPGDVLKFVADWVDQGLTDQHVAVGTKILDSISCVAVHDSLSLMHSTEKTLHTACDEMIYHVDKAGLAGHEKLTQRVSKLRNQCFRIKDSSGYNLRVPPNVPMPSCAKHAADTEDVLITVSPRQCVVDHFDDYILMNRLHPRPYDEAVFDMCAYVPSTRCWYHIESLDDQQDVYTLLDENSLDDWIFTMRSDQLVFTNVSGVDVNSMTLYHMSEGTWEKHAFGEQVEEYLQDNESCNDFFVVKDRNNTLYMITVINCFDDEFLENCVEMFFRCFKYQESDHSWQVLFHTEKFSMAENDFQNVTLHANISTISNEMLVTYCDKLNQNRSIFLVANLNLETPVPVTIWDSYESDEFDACPSRNASVVQGKKQFFILYDSMQDDRRIIKVKYEYRYLSNKLTPVETEKKELGGTDLIERGSQGHLYGFFYTPCLTELNVSEGESAWYICGDKGTVSSLTEVTVNRNRTPVVKVHTPPPFNSVTAAFAGTVTKDILDKFKPVSFLGKADANFWQTRIFPWDQITEC